MRYGFFVNGTTITLKNVPPEIHRSLKERARRNNRSLNQEVILALESSLFGYREQRSTLRQPPPLRSVGKVLVSREQLDSRADDFMERGAGR
jgi:plasmid stability protein